MAEFQISIVGLGVTGTSLGLALRKVSRDICIVGHDRDSSAAASARKAKAVDRTDWNLPAACRGSDIVILALPLPALRDTMAAIAEDLVEGCLVTDTAPLKAPVLAWARETLPAHVHFVGGDPVGARGQAAEAAADLFSGTTYCLCPDSATPPRAVERASDLATAIGAKPHFLDAAEHDGLLALLDQLPFLLGAAVLQSASGSAAWRELARLGGGRFEQVLTTLGDSPLAELQVAAANSENIGRWLDRTQEALDSLRALLAAGPEAGEQAMERLLAARAEWRRHGEDAPGPRPEAGFNLRRLFLGR